MTEGDQELVLGVDEDGGDGERGLEHAYVSGRERISLAEEALFSTAGSTASICVHCIAIFAFLLRSNSDSISTNGKALSVWSGREARLVADEAGIEESDRGGRTKGTDRPIQVEALS